MAGRQKSFRGEHASDEVFDFECGPCKFDGKNLEANGFCSDCSEYLCELCFRTHLKPMPCRHHILLDASKMPRDKSAVKTVDVSTVRCEKHAANVIEYYCSIHEYIGCSTCMTLEHRACEGVNHIPSITKELYETREYVEFKQSVNTVVKSTTHNGLEIKRNTTETKRIYKKTKEEIKQYRKEINSFIDNLENKIDTELSKLNDNYISLLQEATDCNKSLEKEITTVAEEVTNREKQAKRIDSFVFMKRTKGSIQQCTKKVDETLDKLKVRSYSFQNEFDKHKPALKGLFGSIVEEVTTKQNHVGRWKEGGGPASCRSHMELRPRDGQGQPIGDMPCPPRYNMPFVKRGIMPPYRAPFTGGAPEPCCGPEALVTPTTSTKKGEDDDEVWRQHNQRQEEKEKRFDSDRRRQQKRN